MSRRGQVGRKAGETLPTANSQFATAATAAGLGAQPGMSALKGEYRQALEVRRPARFSGSVDLDEALRDSEPQAARWDYGVGVVGAVEKAFWIEPHPASSTGEVQKMLNKLAWLKATLARPEFAGLLELTNRTLAEGSSAYIWLHSGANRILPNSRDARLLASKGLTQPKRYITLA